MIGQSKIIPASKLQRICLESDQKVFFSDGDEIRFWDDQSEWTFFVPWLWSIWSKLK